MPPVFHEPMIEKWPRTILHEGREIPRVATTPTFATYLLPASKMNGKVYLTRDVWERWLRGEDVTPKPKKQPKKKNWVDIARNKHMPR
jgi:hypothetical protein